uniref:CRTAC1 family protein n=1 Tax=Schlesneria paludicola TaxID=360056 RepID=A0A7C4LKX6_9PLAN
MGFPLRWSMLAATVALAIPTLGCHRSGGAPAPASLLRADKAEGQSTNTATSVASSEATSIRFVERTSGAGIEWTYRNGEEAGRFAILESLGGGVGVIDFDGDGWEDLYFTGGGRFSGERELAGWPGGLFRNGGEGTFQVATEPAGLNQPGYYSHGATVADYDQDGFSDLLVTGYGGLQLWRNQGDGTFRETAQAAGLTDNSWSSSAAWGDLNGDGALDLYVTHYVNWSFENDPFCAAPAPHEREVCPPRTFEPLPDTLYFSRGDGTFWDGSRHAGLLSTGKGLGVVLCDLDLDGDLDVYVTNDTVENFLYENTGDGKLADVSLLSGTALSDRGTPDGSMGVDLFDFNRDGLPDLWIVNYERESCALYQNAGKLLFRHVSQPLGITAVGGMYVGWGTACFDMDLDADEDIFVSNGHVIRYPTNAPLRQRPLVFENEGGKRFRNVAEQAGEYTRAPHMGRGIALSDFDGDGDLDLAISHTNEPATLLANETPRTGHWLAVRLIGTRSARDPIGAVVRVVTANSSQVRHLRGGGSYASTSTRLLHWGLGADSAVDRVEIRWPSGVRQTIVGPAVDAVLHVIEPIND